MSETGIDETTCGYCPEDSRTRGIPIAVIRTQWTDEKSGIRMGRTVVVCMPHLKAKREEFADASDATAWLNVLDYL